MRLALPSFLVAVFLVLITGQAVDLSVLALAPTPAIQSVGPVAVAGTLVATSAGLVQTERQRKIAELTIRLGRISDPKKREKLLALDNKLQQINIRNNDAWQKKRVTLRRVLASLQTQTGNLKKAGKDTTALGAELDFAAGLLDAFEKNLDVQSRSDYTLVLTSESGARNDVQVVANKQKQEWASLHVSLKPAQEKLRSALTQAERINSN